MRERRTYVVMEKGRKCKDMVEVRCGDGMRRLACIAFSPSFGCCHFVRGRIRGLNSHSLAALGVYQIPREKGGTQNPWRKAPSFSLSNGIHCLSNQVRDEEKRWNR